MSRFPVVLYLAATITLWAAASAADRTPPAADPALQYRLYVGYSNAVQAGKVDEARQYLSKSKLSELKGLSEAKLLAELTPISPLSDLTFKSETVEGDEATLRVTGKVFQNDAAGTVRMVLEDGEWKVLSETWKLAIFDGVKKTAEDPGQKEAIKKLEELGFSAPFDEDFVSSAIAGRLPLVKLFLQAGASIESRVQGSTALIESARTNEDVALYLIEKGADVDAFSDSSMTALMSASELCSMTAVVKALLAKGARVDIQSGLDGKTALQMAEESNCSKNAALIRAAQR